jgi:hypothetical protein
MFQERVRRFVNGMNRSNASLQLRVRFVRTVRRIMPRQWAPKKSML